MRKHIYTSEKNEVDPHVAAILSFSKTFKKSPAHLRIMGNVIVKFE